LRHSRFSRMRTLRNRKAVMHSTEQVNHQRTMPRSASVALTLALESWVRQASSAMVQWV
jgi:hypothetical protein